jgi:cytochrome c-type biogenesis protein CcmF
MSSELGHLTLMLAWLFCCSSLLLAITAALRSSSALFLASIRATISCGALLFISLASLAGAFLAEDYTNQFVWQFSSRDMPWVYKITAVWGGMDGSMLLWASFLGLGAAFLAIQQRRATSEMMAWVIAAANSSTLFFTSVTLFSTNPFRYLQTPIAPADGNGLNPLLQNPYMAIHPPMLYAGFTLFAVPFAFCLGALASGNLSNKWIMLTRRWTLVAWAFLTVGITLGGHWAYLELGWGGFWAWDPVENSSFLPWLSGTAFLHSVMIQERKQMLRFWNVWLIGLTYGLTVFGTFLTRSGIVQSIHAFASTDIGWLFLTYLSVLSVGLTWLSYHRRALLRSERSLESLLSREAFFLFNNLVFLSICFSVLWGVMFPVISEAITGVKQTIGAPFFNAVTIPFFLLMLFLMGVGPAAAWRRSSGRRLFDSCVTPAIGGLAIGVFLLTIGVRGFYPTLAYSLSWFVVLSVLRELYRAVRAQRLTHPSLFSATSSALSKHHRRFAGALVHVGVALTAVAITSSMAHKTEQELSLKPGESASIGRYSITLKELSEERRPNYQALAAHLDVTQIGDKSSPPFSLTPEMRRYFRNQETTSEVALRMHWLEDLYIVLAGVHGDDSGSVALKVFINPLQVWLWVGVLIMTMGTLAALSPRAMFVHSSEV